eukprot:g7365.t2
MRDHYGNTLLHGAAHGGQPPVFQALLDAGVDVSLRNNERFTPLMIASQKGRVDLFRSVVERGLNDVNDTCVNGMSPLFLATEEAGVDMVKAVLAAGGDVQSRTIDGWTPLHAAARRGNVRVIRALLRGGSDVASRGQSAITPLYLAGKEGHLEAVRALMKAGADPLAACSFGFSPLYNAIVDSHPVMAAAMLETLERRDEDRGTAYPSRGSVVGKALFQVDRRRMSLVQGAAYGLELRSLSKLLSMGALEPFSQKGGDGGAAEYVELVTRSDAHLPPKNPARKAAMHRMIARRPAFTARSWLWPTAGGRQRGSGAGSGAGRSRVSVFRPEQGALRSVVVARALRRYCIKNGPSSSSLGVWPAPPSDTWLSLVACAAFEAVLLFLCYHEQGPELARRGPSILRRWLKPRVNDAGAAPVAISPPSSVAQSWRLGALHERFFRGARAGQQSTLREAGAVLGVGRPLTEGSYDIKRWRRRVCGAIATIGPALYYLTTPIHAQLAEILRAMVKVLHTTPMSLLCLASLTVSMALVCDGFRAPDDGIGGRIALTGGAGAIASMFFSTMLQPWQGEWFTLYSEQGMVFFAFGAAVLVPIAVKFDFGLCGFLAVVSAFYCAAFVPVHSTWRISYIVAAIFVDCLFALAVCLPLKTRTLQPFCSGFMAMGVSLLHASLFINSFSHYFEFWALRRNMWPHVVEQLPVGLALLAGWVVGKSISCDGLVNNTLLFGTIYLFVTTFTVSGNLLPGYGGQYVGLAVVCVGLWRIGLYLHGHRDFVSTLWSVDAALLRRGCRSDSNDKSGSSAGFGRGGVELLLEEDPLFEPESGAIQSVAKQSSTPSSASNHLLRNNGGVAAYGVLPS